MADSDHDATRFCSQQTLRAEDPLYGTASGETTVWFLLEYNEPWAPRAITDNFLPGEVQQWLQEALDKIPQSRLLFIRKERPTPGPKKFYIAISQLRDQRLYQFLFDDYLALRSLDLKAAVEHEGAYRANQVAGPLVLVCTNGKRDPCCAKFGLPVYRALAELDQENVWQCTHIGGHRYAATAAVLPAGVYYGHIVPEMASVLLQHAHNNQIILDLYRGRTCYNGREQAAEYFVRQKTGRLGLDDMHLFRATVKNDRWLIQFLDSNESTRYKVTLTEEMSEPRVASCSPLKSKPQPRYHLVEIEIKE